MLAPLGSGVDIVVISRAVTGRDDYGNDVYSTVETTYSGCGFWPGTAGRNVAGSREYGDIDSRHSVITRGQVLLPDGAVVNPEDFLRLPSVSDRKWKPTGETQQWKSQLTGASSGVELSIEWVAG